VAAPLWPSSLILFKARSSIRPPVAVGNQIRRRLTFTTAYSGSIHLYAVDWDVIGRRETITVDDGSGVRSANISTDFSQGAWVSAPINVAAGGTVTVTVTRTAGLNAFLSGIFLG
jgi:hypothetical protein